MQKQYCCFSEAIRDGAKLRPKSTGHSRSQGIGSCVLIAGLEAITGSREIDEDYKTVSKLFSYLKTLSRCPAPNTGLCVYGERQTELLTLIWHLNDSSHDWSREAIADWLYAEEEKLGFVTIDTEVQMDSEREHDMGQVVATV